jgi:hypothetical protein
MRHSPLNNSVLGGAEMNNYAKSIKRKLDQSIQKLLWNRKEYVHNPERDFNRNRKLSLGTLIELLITMQGLLI